MNIRHTNDLECDRCGGTAVKGDELWDKMGYSKGTRVVCVGECGQQGLATSPRHGRGLFLDEGEFSKGGN